MTGRGIQSLVVGNELVDVLLVGFIEGREPPVQFYALQEILYFRCGESLIRFGTDGDSIGMQIEVSATIEHTAMLDDDMTPAITSIRQQLLRDPHGSNIIASMRLWDAVDDADTVRCAAARVDLVNGQRIFVDPSNHFGIQLGGRELEELWSDARGG